jgi:hypothetical protein
LLAINSSLATDWMIPVGVLRCAAGHGRDCRVLSQGVEKGDESLDVWEALRDPQYYIHGSEIYK